jgi:GMP synthase-like glutamine amidotransferase
VTLQGVINTAVDVFLFPHSLEVSHGHGKTFELPEGVIQSAKNEEYAHQAFQLGKNVNGLLFHIKTTSESFQAILSHFRGKPFTPISLFFDKPTRRYRFGILLHTEG